MPMLLQESEVASLLRMEDLIDLMERTLAEFSSGRALQPVRIAMPLEKHGAFLGTMPAYLVDADALGVKLVTLALRNAERGMPTHLATILLFDPATGALLAIMDGRLVTEMRTAAVSAAAARTLARVGAGDLALLGSGVQAKSHLEAFRSVRPLRRVRVWSPTREHRETFASEESARHSLPVEAVESAAMPTWSWSRPRAGRPCCGARGSRPAPTSPESARSGRTGASWTEKPCAAPASTWTRAPEQRPRPAT